MKRIPEVATPSVVHVSHRMRLAKRLLDGHRGLDDSSLLVHLTGSAAAGLADERSSLDLGIAFAEMPGADQLERACTAAGASAWHRPLPADETAELQARFSLDGVEVRVHYFERAGLHRRLEALLQGLHPAGALHDLADGLLEAVPLFGHRPLEALQAELAAFSDALAGSMARHYTSQPMRWRELARLIHRDAPLRCRELQIDGCRQLLGQLAAINRRYLGPARELRLHDLAARFERSPPGLADRIEALLAAPPRLAALALHALEGEVLALLADRFASLDLAERHRARAEFSVG